MLSLPAPLEHKVQRLLENESAVVIDNTFVTVQEYQSFVSDELARGRYRQPDHWAGLRDTDSEVDKPVLGIRPDDAQSFCSWLSKKVSAIRAVQFRLPRLNEVGIIGATDVVPWVVTDDEIVLAADSQLQQQWEQELFQRIQDGFDTDFSCDFDLPLHRRVSKNTVRDAAIERARNRNRHSPLQQRLRERLTTLRQVWAVKPDAFPDAALNLKKTLHRVCGQQSTLTFYRELARDLDRAIREANDLALIRAYLLCVHTAWDFVVI